MSEKRVTFHRFGLLERIEHSLMLLSFSVLVLTGLPQKFAEWGISMAIIRAIGGIGNVRTIHHISAILMIILALFHAIHVAYKIIVLNRPLAMLPGIKDAKDAIQLIASDLGLAQSRPTMGRYNFGEKIEYWAVVWGTVLMAITGYMLWNPILITKFLPGEFIPAAKAAHGSEAILAALSILSWHFYYVHLKYFNKSMFTGRISFHEMEEEHAEELQRLLADKEHPLPPPEVIRRRRRIFMPLASVLAVVFLLFTYRFFTIEQTAITTVPPIPGNVAIFAKASPTPTPPRNAQMLLYDTPAPALAHSISEGRENCLWCHGTGSIVPFSAPHADPPLGNETCLACHLLQPENLTPLPSIDLAHLPSFRTDILPMLQSKCTSCHGSVTPPDLSSYAGIMAGTQSGGPLIIPGDAEHSRVLLVQSMPLEAHPTRLTPEELNLLSAWIQVGAPNN
ncbi:MAG: hypothetical protein GXP37_00845 [Chloroflexi bacterium]|nr:hypothetical protein [Chloroflexota bacterium]